MANKQALNIVKMKKMKADGERLSMLTAYDYPSALLAEEAGIDLILVGDSLGNVVLGYDTTLPVTIDDMVYHTRSVTRGAQKTFIVADMPFMTYHGSIDETLRGVRRLMQEGRAHAVKMEGGLEICETVTAVVAAGVPVLGHIGLTPQSVNMTEEVAQAISEALSIPTIGIGAGRYCDGQVLVFHDLLRYSSPYREKRFVKTYADVGNVIREGISQYVQEVKDRSFPDEGHVFKADETVLESLYGGAGKDGE